MWLIATDLFGGSSAFSRVSVCFFLRNNTTQRPPAVRRNRSPQVCHRLSSPRYTPSFEWQALANTVWALAVLGHHDKEALSAVEREVAARMRSVTADTADRDGAREGEVAAKMRSATADTAGGKVAEDGLHLTR